MLRKILMIFAVLILTYLVLVHYGGFGKDIAAITNFTTSTTKAFQGR